MLENLNKYGKYFTYLVIAIFVYGYISRWFDIYFFWESKIIALPLIILIMFYSSIKGFIKKREFFSIEFIWIVLCMFGFYQIFNEFNLNKLAVEKSKNFIKDNQLIINKVGKINDISFPVNNKNLSGSDFSINFIVKGEKKFSDVTVNLYYQDRNFKRNDFLKIVSFEIDDDYNFVDKYIK